MTPSSVVRGGGALDGLDALVDDVGVAHMMGAEEALEGGAARQLGGFEGRPLGEEIAEDGGVFVVEPLEDVREVVLQGTGKAIREAHFVAHEAAAMFDEVLEGTHVGALGVEGVEFVAMREQKLTLEFGVRGVVLGVAGGEGLTVSREGTGIDGKEHEEVILAQGGAKRALIKFEADGDWLALEPLAQGANPCIDGVCRVLGDGVLAFVRAGGL
jgi:hypothetical protein